MKNILLVGDSIRSGYDQYVKESFEGIANVYYPDENCRFAQYVLRNLHEWVENTGEKSIDVIHWNAGLWDTLRVYEDDCLTPIDTYVDFLLRIQGRIEKICPEAISIFATSTPVIEDGFIPDYSVRYNVDIERYNRAATEALAKRGVIINDLYSPLMDVPSDYHSDQTHFYTAKATELIGGRVNEALCSALGIDFSVLSSPDAKKFEIVTLKNDKEMYVKKGNKYVPIVGV
jgi:hypothetical protein